MSYVVKIRNLRFCLKRSDVFGLVVTAYVHTTCRTRVDKIVGGDFNSLWVIEVEGYKITGGSN